MKINRLLKTTLRHIRRNSWFSYGTIAIISLTFFITSILVVFNYVINVALNDFEKKGQIAVFFKVGTEVDFVEKLQEDLERTNNTSSIKFRSEKEAMELFKQINKDDPTISEVLEEGILPSSLHINTNKLEDLDQILVFLEDKKNMSTNIDEIKHNKNIADILIEINRWTRIAGIASFIMMAFISLLIIIITISTNISVNQQEIEIMQLVGGGDWYIRLPYVIEGAIYGFVGSLLSIILIVIIYILTRGIWQDSATFSFLDSYFGSLEWPGLDILSLSLFIGIKMIVAIIIGSLSSMFAVIKYIK